KIHTMYEPFVGTGSIFINNKINRCIGEDTNPLAVQISKAKLDEISFEELEDSIKLINSLETVNIQEYEFPVWNSFERYVSKDKYNLVLSFLDLFNFYSIVCKNFIKMVVVCNLDKIFDYKKDGNGIKFRKSKIEYNDCLLFLKKLVLSAINSKKKYQETSKKLSVSIIFDSATNYKEDINDVDLVISSPPYCNMFDYFEVYKMELWTSGIIKNNEEHKKLKKSAIRSNVNANINEDKIKSTTLEICLNQLIKKHCSTQIIKMINNYFYDLNKVLGNVYKYLNDNSYFFIVVGNSFYKGVPVITDEILSEIGLKNGFTIEKIIKTRKLNTSPQQMYVIDQNNYQYLRESIIVLKKEH
ncbi:MAG: site-specific DNA-methyltransferase, partial [Firmicutes bacterium]|nr:site-specific DNA-methyltransferase [Bacillota bacterium]